ncbi:cysteine desulfurase NifS [mine drainage metagenome]|uniref:cysteine desulfurase n=1 Tax=mine drainage metagenome TaxID=410659 RepID=A0A1J5QT75_9ZZZZ
MVSIYLDYNATTPVAPEVVAAMLPFLQEHFGNPSSDHAYADAPRRAMAEAREDTARLIGARAAEIVFTGSATEANNLALLGVARALGDARRHAVISAIEHPSVSEPARRLQERGWSVTVVPVDAYGRVAPGDVAAALRSDTGLVSVMHANNEVGTIQPIAEIATLVHRRGALLHTDAAQSAGKVALDVEALGVDLLTLAGHKFHAPKGIGALYVRAGTPIAAVLAGAGQEQGLRPGTENIPHIVALGAAARLARERLPETRDHLRALRDRLHARLAQEVPGLALNGHPEQRLPNTLNVSFPGVSGALLLQRVADRVAAATGSACHAGDAAPSAVLEAMGLSNERAAGAVRLSVGYGTREDEIDTAAAALVAAWRERTVAEHG